MSEQEKIELAKQVKEECIKAAREGFRDASMSGLCAEGALEAAVSAMQLLNLEQVINDTGQYEDTN